MRINIPWSRRGVSACLVAFALLIATGSTWAQVQVNWVSPSAGTVFNTREGTLPPYTTDLITLTAAATATQGFAVSKVEFFYGTTLIGTATPGQAPSYSFNWNNVPTGTYAVYAKATAIKSSKTVTAVTAAINIVVNARPYIKSLSPVKHAQVPIGTTSFPISVDVADPDGSVAKVDFYYDGELCPNAGGTGGTLLGTVTSPPYSVIWNVPQPYYDGSGFPKRSCFYTVVTDNLGATGSSTVLGGNGVISVVSLVPIVSITSPANGGVYSASGGVPITVTVTPADFGIQSVRFYNGANRAVLIGEPTTPPYSMTWQGLTSGTYTVAASMVSTTGFLVLGPTVTFTVNAAPSISLTSPVQNATFKAPATIAITASAADSDGTITKVDFFQGTTLIGTASAAPYSVSWNGVAQGTYSLTAVATDDSGASTTSAPVTVTVGPAGGQMYFIEVDHLNTPRLIVDSAGATVWRNDNTEPFGDSVPDENPSGSGAFTFGLRFRGQYSDTESGLRYNYFRDCYDPSAGRYCQSDPIGLRGGQNTYAYVMADPLRFVDPFGLVRPGQSSIEAKIESAIIRGDVRTLETLVESDVLTPAQQSAAQAGLREIEILQNSTGNTGKLAEILNRSKKEIERAIHACKRNLSKSAPERNPDTVVDIRSGEIYPKLESGRIGDSIGNIHDYLVP